MTKEQKATYKIMSLKELITALGPAGLDDLPMPKRCDLPPITKADLRRKRKILVQPK